jgi:hypothetical protein
VPRKKVDVLEVWPKGEELDLPRYSFGAVCKVLGLEAWRLQKFLDSPRYKLKASGHLGEGKGSRKWFSTEDVYRIGLANFLAKDGFAPKLIVKILQKIDDSDLIGFDEHGKIHTGITLTRTDKGPKLNFFRSESRPDFLHGRNIYYILDLDKVTAEIDGRIENVANQKGWR